MGGAFDGCFAEAASSRVPAVRGLFVSPGRRALCGEPLPGLPQTGRRPPFCEPHFGGVRPQREESEGKGLKVMKETKE